MALGSLLATGYCLSGGFGPRLEPEPFRETGRVLARQTLALLKPGGHVTVVTRDTVTFQNPATDIQFNSLRRELTRAGVKLDTVEALQIDPLRPMTVPAGDFFQWIKKAEPGSVIVSLIGPPMLNESQIAQLGGVQPAIVAFCSGPARDQVDLRALFAQKLLRAAVVSKYPRSVSAVRSGDPRAAFDREFLEVTPENLAVLSSLAPTTP